MAKKDDDLVAKLADIIDRNTRVYELLAQLINSQSGATPAPVRDQGETVPVEKEVPTKQQPAKQPTEQQSPPIEKTEEKVPVVTLEQCREVIVELDQKGANREAAVTFLSKFNAKNMKEVKEADYAEFFKRGMVIVEMNRKKAADKPVETESLI